MRRFTFRAWINRRSVNILLITLVFTLMGLLFVQNEKCQFTRNIDIQRMKKLFDERKHVPGSGSHKDKVKVPNEKFIEDVSGSEKQTTITGNIYHFDYVTEKSLSGINLDQLLKKYNISEEEIEQAIIRKSPEVEESFDVTDAETGVDTNTKSGTKVNRTFKKEHIFSPKDLVQNITTNGKDWFFIIPEESYLQENRSFFTTPRNANNRLEHSFLIKGEEICHGKHPYLLIIFPSVVSHADKRKAMRKSWLLAAETDSWPNATINRTIKHLFLFGYQQDLLDDDFSKLQEESKTHGDIVMADFVDTYRNLTRKILTGLNWTLQYCSQAQVVLKTDEDTFVNVPLMLELLQNVSYVSSKTGIDTFVLGLKHMYQKPPVVRGGRWAVSEVEYPLPYYPCYLYGHTYAVNYQAIRKITQQAVHVPLISPEDAYITGILPKFANITKFSAPSFTVCCRPIYDCEVVWNQRVALTSLDKVELLEELWAKVNSHACNSSKPFIDRTKKAHG